MSLCRSFSRNLESCSAEHCKPGLLPELMTLQLVPVHQHRARLAYCLANLRTTPLLPPPTLSCLPILWTQGPGRK